MNGTGHDPGSGGPQALIWACFVGLCALLVGTLGHLLGWLP